MGLAMYTNTLYAPGCYDVACANNTLFPGTALKERSS